MDEDIDFYLLNPFNEVVEKALAAIDTAQDGGNDDMLKAAQTLQKEAERARKSIDPMARRHLAQYGANFVEALRDDKDISGHIDPLNDLIYDFDDFTEADTFDAERYSELGEKVREAAKRIAPILRRMRLEAPAPQPFASTPPTPQLPAASPTTGSTVSRINSLGARSAISTFSTVVPRSAHPDDVEHVPGQIPSGARSDAIVPGQVDPTTGQPLEETPVMGIQSGPDLGWNNGQPRDGARVLSPSPSRQSLTSAALVTVPPPPPPPAPSTNPWQLSKLPQVSEGDEQNGEPSDAVERTFSNGASETNGLVGNGDVPERRRRISTRPDSPTLPSPTTATSQSPEWQLSMVPPPPPPVSSFEPSSLSHQGIRRLDEGVEAWQRQIDAGTPSPRTVSLGPDQLASPHVNVPLVSASWTMLPQQAPPVQSQCLVQQQPFPRQSVFSQNTGQPSDIDRKSPRQSQCSTITTSTASSTTNGSMLSYDSYLNNLANQMRDSSLDPISPIAGPAGCPVSPNNQVHPQLLSSFVSNAQHQQPYAIMPALPMAPVMPAEQPGLEAIQVAMHIDDGLIPVVGDQASVISNARPRHARPADCNIGPGSAFHLLKGFCEGAKDVMRGNPGVRKIQKLSYSGSGTFAAKCTNCLYELQWAEIEKDRQRLPSANYRMHSISFRLRFLSKSHLPAKQVDDPLYACLFCVHEGRTLEESDATVFFSQSQLFSHLARHPRPLPNVPGVRVIDGPERPEEFRNDYDLHFSLPPVPSELDGIRRELQQLPTGTAIETFRKSHGTLRRPADNTMPIQFPAGSKIVGIEFPAKYKGEWGVGWFDNMFGPFPADFVRLDTPPKNEIRTQGASPMRATVRWKWAVGTAYRNTDWLRLEKNETVTNVVWSYPDHWCWAGTNSRGNWGYFPQSHIEPNTLVEAAGGSDTSSVMGIELSKSGGGGFLSRLRSHNSHSNPQVRRPVSVASHSTSSSR